MENFRDQEAQQQRQAAAARVALHSQVRKIKEEEGEKVKVHETYQQQQVAEMRLVIRDLGRQRSRSPLGRVGRPAAISIGGDS